MKEYVLSPIREYKDVRRKIAEDLVQYGDVIGNPGSGSDARITEARTELRSDAASLRGVRDEMPETVARVIPTISSQEDLETVEARLIRLSNMVQGTGIDAIDDVELANSDRKEVRGILNLKD